MDKTQRWILVVSVLLALTTVAEAQSRTSWEMNYGEGLVSFGFTTPRHGAVVEYDFATIPPADDAGWRAAPNGETIGFDETPSTLCGQLACRRGGQFTYFQSFVSVPSNVEVTAFTIAFSGVDDGVRVTIFNSQFPDGVVVPGSYVFLGGSGTANLADLVSAGEVNRVVVTHVDDCCVGTRLRTARVVLNGRVIEDDCDGDDDGLCEEDDCDDTDPTIGAVLYENDFDSDTGWFQATPALSDDPWTYGNSAVSSTGPGQQALIGAAQSWSDIIVWARLAATGTLGGCCGNEGPIHRWRAGIVVRGVLDDDQDEGYHGYRCALSSNAEAAGGVLHAGPSTGHFLQLAEFMDGPEDDIASECEGGANTTFDEHDRARHELLDLAAGDEAEMVFRAVGDSLSCEVSTAHGTVSVAGSDSSFSAGTVGLSTLNMLGEFRYIKVCEVLNGGAAVAPEPAIGADGNHDSGDSVAEARDPLHAEPGDNSRAAAEDPAMAGCSVTAGTPAEQGWLLLVLGVVALGRRRWRR